MKTHTEKDERKYKRDSGRDADPKDIHRGKGGPGADNIRPRAGGAKINMGRVRAPKVQL